MTFAQLNLDPSITKAIQACGYTKPTPIQAQSIPTILNGEDLLASAQTGTGKTAAFVLPALHRLSLQTNAVRRPRVLILTPTRELASQITQAAAKYGKFVRFYMASLVGGMSYRQQLRDLSKPVDMIVATPGRLLDHLENRRLDLSGIEMLVLDEADRMLDMGFIDDVQMIAKATPNNRQTLLFSATVDGKLNNVIKQLLKNPIRIDLSNEKLAPAKIKQVLYHADSQDHRSRLLQHLLDNEKMFKAIIFSATKIGADKLTGQLCDKGFAAAALHGDLKQTIRNRTVEQLRRGKIQFVVATDVASRGIDIADMTHVINYDMPRFCEDYVHRIGRTGRAGKSGVAISFALPSDARHIQRIEKYMGARLDVETIEGLEPNPKIRRGGSTDQPKKKNHFKGKGRSFDKGSEKPKKKWGFKDDARGGRSDKPKKSWGFKDDARGGRSDKPKKSWDFKDDTRGGRSDKPKKSWGFKDDTHGGRSDKPKKSWGFKDNNDSRDVRSSKPKTQRNFRDESRGDARDKKDFRSGRSDKPKKNWDSKEGQAGRFEKSNKKWSNQADSRGARSEAGKQYQKKSHPSRNKRHQD